jgi:hypothetical protein
MAVNPDAPAARQKTAVRKTATAREPARKEATGRGKAPAPKLASRGKSERKRGES